MKHACARMIEIFTRWAISPTLRLLLLAGVFGVMAFAQVNPLQPVLGWTDGILTSIWTYVGGLAILFMGFELIWGSGHGKIAGLIAGVVGLALIKYHAILPNAF